MATERLTADELGVMKWVEEAQLVDYLQMNLET